MNDPFFIFLAFLAGAVTGAVLAAVIVAKSAVRQMEGLAAENIFLRYRLQFCFRALQKTVKRLASQPAEETDPADSWKDNDGII